MSKTLVNTRVFAVVENSVDNVQNYLYNVFIIKLCKPYYFEFFTIFSLPFFYYSTFYAGFRRWHFSEIQVHFEELFSILRNILPYCNFPILFVIICFRCFLRLTKSCLYYIIFFVLIAFAGVAQSVVQLIRNQQVACSSHVTSSRNTPKTFRFRGVFVL